MEQLTVPQEHGKDSVVDIREEMREAYPRPVPVLSFYTDQSLASNSGRAWNVRKAIKDYCLERGYRITNETQHEIIAQYDPRQHSYCALDSLRKGIQEDERYVRALTAGKREVAKIQDTYGPAITTLKAMIRTLETDARVKLGRVADEVAWVQNSVIADQTFPSHLLPSEQEMLHRPLFQPELDHYARYRLLADLSASEILGMLE